MKKIIYTLIALVIIGGIAYGYALRANAQIVDTDFINREITQYENIIGFLQQQIDLLKAELPMGTTTVATAPAVVASTPTVSIVAPAINNNTPVVQISLTPASAPTPPPADIVPKCTLSVSLQTNNLDDSGNYTSAVGTWTSQNVTSGKILVGGGYIAAGVVQFRDIYQGNPVIGSSYAPVSGGTLTGWPLEYVSPAAKRFPTYFKAMFYGPYGSVECDTSVKVPQDYLNNMGV